MTVFRAISASIQQDLSIFRYFLKIPHTTKQRQGVLTMKKKTKRVILDAALTGMTVFEMFIQYTGNLLHEVIGFAFFATVIVHLALSAKWIKNASQAANAGKLKGKRKSLAIMACLLGASMVVLGISSVAISGLLSQTGFVWPLGAYDMWEIAHAISSYVLCALVIVHLAMHWTFLASAFKVPYDPARRSAIGAGVNAVAAIGAIALCSTAAGKTITQAAAETTFSENTSSTPFDNVSDIIQNSENPSDASFSEETLDHKHHGKNQPYESTTSGSDPNSNASGSSDANSQDTSSVTPSSPTSSSSTTGTCTLCGRRCPLSSPQCDKPYAAGLL